MTVLVLNTLCDRVIFFTADEAYRPPYSSYTWVAYTDDPLPANMTLENCWSYRFRGSKLYYDDALSNEERTLSTVELMLVRNKRELKSSASKKLVAPELPTAMIALFNGVLSDQATCERYAKILNVTADEARQRARISLELNTADQHNAAFQILEFEKKVEQATTLTELEALRTSL